ncbi:MAG: NAD-dependent epimerase/dehydratase family protein [Synechococcaceae cyanobacterium SM1_2_3]|nr:NAD-dependent epimerase/dehydratase family protein [Synechococcaceae cyanobacterium SM1_2_3]
MKILITGSAGFIGAALSLRLLQRGDEVIGYDNLNDYYDVTLKQARLARLQPHPGFTDIRASLEDRAALTEVFAPASPAADRSAPSTIRLHQSTQRPAVFSATPTKKTNSSDRINSNPS